jgi:hypothetical protein
MLPCKRNGEPPDAYGSPEPIRPGKQTPKRAHAVAITDETIKTSERELNSLIQTAAEKIARTRDLIAKLDGLLAKTNPFKS